MSKGGRYASGGKNPRRESWREDPELELEEQAQHAAPSAPVKKPKKKKRKKSAVQVIFTVLLVLIVLIGAVGIGFGAYFYGMMTLYKVPMPESKPADQIVLESQFQEIVDSEETELPEETTVPAPTKYKPSDKDILNILVVGQSGRNGETAEAARYADTAMLFTVNKNTKTLTMTSILRDAWVKLPDFTDASGHTYQCGSNRINTAYALGYQWGDTAGAMQMMNETMYNNFGVEVDFNIEVDFEGFIAVIDSIGGVEIEITQAEADYLNKDDLYVYEDVEAGKVKMNGMTALSYARMRKASGDGDSDINRTKRQRNLIVSLLNQVMGLDFADLRGMARYAMTFVTTNMTADNITTCLWEIIPMLTDLKIVQGTCPVETTYWGEIVDFGGTPASVLKFSQSQNTRLMQEITEGIKAE